MMTSAKAVSSAASGAPDDGRNDANGRPG